MSSPKASKYRLFGERVVSDITLGEFPIFRTGQPDISISKKERVSKRRLCWYHRVRAQDGKIFNSFARIGSKYFIRMHGAADFEISKNGSQVFYHSKTACSQADIVAHLLSFVIPFALTLKGREILHASAVRIGRGAVAFVGTQGSGKSTLAAAFARHSFKVISDDALPLLFKNKNAHAVPSFPEIRLYEHTIDGIWGRGVGSKFQKAFLKKRTTLGNRFCSEPIPLKAIFMIDSVPKQKKRIHFVSLGPTQAWMSLVENSYRLDFSNPRRLHREMDTFAQLLSQVPVKRLHYPRSMKSLSRVIKTIIREVGP